MKPLFTFALNLGNVYIFPELILQKEVLNAYDLQISVTSQMHG